MNIKDDSMFANHVVVQWIAILPCQASQRLLGTGTRTNGFTNKQRVATAMVWLNGKPWAIQTSLHAEIWGRIPTLWQHCVTMSTGSFNLFHSAQMWRKHQRTQTQLKFESKGGRMKCSHSEESCATITGKQKKCHLLGCKPMEGSCCDEQKEGCLACSDCKTQSQNHSNLTAPWWPSPTLISTWSVLMSP